MGSGPILWAAACRPAAAQRWASSTLRPRDTSAARGRADMLWNEAETLLTRIIAVCARFTLFTPGQRIAELFHLSQVPALIPRYNVAPSQLIAVVGTKAGGGGRGLAIFRWGFIPHWANDQKGPKPVNAKAETIASNMSFRD